MDPGHINAGIIGATLFASLYYIQREFECARLARTDPRVDINDVRQVVEELRRERDLTAHLGANLIENTFRGHKPKNTEILKSLREYHDELGRDYSGWEFLRSELTSFPTFRGIHRSLIPKTAHI